MLLRVTAIALTLCTIALQPARADTVLVSNTSLVVGSQSAVFSFQAPGSGTVVAQVTNIDWPQTLGSLTFAATSADKMLASWSDPPTQTADTLTFDVSGPGWYFAHISATAQGPLDLGVYSLCIKFVPPTSAVPLPSTLWLLLTGLATLAAWSRFGPARSAITIRSNAG